MSDRANYAILFRKKLSVYYAAWGGPTIQRELKDGPAACERFIRQQVRERKKQFLEFAFMEGGIALDKDQKRVLFFGGPGAINYYPEVQKRLVERLRPVWEREGWTIDWAKRYAYDLIEFLGLPGTRIEADFYLGHPFEWEKVVEMPLEWVSTLVARRREGGWEARGSKYSAGTLIHHGPKLLDSFDELPVLPPLDSHSAGTLTAILIDEQRRTVVIVSPLFGSLNAPHCLVERAQAAFEGWTIELDLDLPLPWKRLRERGLPVPLAEEGKANIEALTDAEIDEILDNALVYAPEAQIEELVAAGEAMIADLVAEAEAQGQTVTVIKNPGKEKRPKAQRRKDAI
jgi:hypothetical protein